MSGSTRPVKHPCYHLGYNLTLTLGDLYDSPCVARPVTFNPASEVTFTGTSEPLRCLNQMKNIMNLTACSLAPDCGFNGVYQPPVSGNFFVSIHPISTQSPLNWHSRQAQSNTPI